MATAEKHKLRSHRSYHDSIPHEMFERKANLKKVEKESKSFFTRLFHRTTKKGD